MKLWASVPGYVKKTMESEIGDDSDISGFSKSLISSQKFNNKNAKLRAKRKYSQESIPNSVTHTDRSHGTNIGYSNSK
jgi:hypothetical protein